MNQSVSYFAQAHIPQGSDQDILHKHWHSFSEKMAIEVQLSLRYNMLSSVADGSKCFF
jgi:hypothetical protein